MKLTIIDREGQTQTVEAAQGTSLMEVLRESVDLTLGTCGGQISCGTCLVRLDPTWFASLPPACEDETDMLEALDAAPESRLSCQLILDADADGMSATITPSE